MHPFKIVAVVMFLFLLIPNIKGAEYISITVYNQTGGAISDVSVGFGDYELCSGNICNPQKSSLGTFYVGSDHLDSEHQARYGWPAYSDNIEGWGNPRVVTYYKINPEGPTECSSSVTYNLEQTNFTKKCSGMFITIALTTRPWSTTNSTAVGSNSPSASPTRSPPASPSPATCGIEATVPEALQKTGLPVFCENGTWVVNGSFTLNSTLDTSQPVEVLGNLTLTNSSMLELNKPNGLIVRGCILLNGSLVVTLEKEVEGNITLKDIITWNCTLKENNQNFESISVQYVKEDECIDSFPESDYGTYSLSVVISGQKNQRNSCFEAESSDNTNVGAIVGGVVGGVLFLVCVVIVVILIVFLVKKIHKRSMKDDNHGKAILF
eukprot:TRINITY_DN2531_c0_g2_i4.p1 TRINITY_DN2531_c0_g2~~TRINITY_DN2531_c0_g2_i4.p1  ORF type:complete len:380 (+),score=55.08 TRINITY_DN2531_c0_g2_i4:229-1368(+)